MPSLDYGEMGLHGDSPYTNKSFDAAWEKAKREIMSNFTPYDYAKDEPGCFAEETPCEECGQADALHSYIYRMLCPDCYQSVRKRVLNTLPIKARRAVKERDRQTERMVRRAISKALATR